MTVFDRYDDFSDLGSPSLSPDEGGSDALANAKLEAFEGGYQAGWDDATKAHKTDQQRLAADLAQNLQDMSFTYHEAFSKLSLAMKPLLTKIVSTILPGLAKKALAGHIMQQMSELIEAQSENAIQIAVAPENLPQIQALLDPEMHLSFDLTADATLVGGQVIVRAARGEREIDLDAMLVEITGAMDAFFENTQPESDHG
ncbi:MAG: flagellar assembly protein FliH [Sulfitobacter sp.]|jgi:flagellar biosynthesis/type III secretory pathway protein FliH